MKKRTKRKAIGVLFISPFIAYVIYAIYLLWKDFPVETSVMLGFVASVVMLFRGLRILGEAFYLDVKW